MAAFLKIFQRNLRKMEPNRDHPRRIQVQGENCPKTGGGRTTGEMEGTWQTDYQPIQIFCVALAEFSWGWAERSRR
jgi:hypothetical protein